MLGSWRTVHEVPGAERPLLAFHQQPALAGEHEKGFLVRLGVVEAARLSRLEDGETDAEVGKRPRVQVRALSQHGRAALEDAAVPERIVAEPCRIPHVDDEPAVADRREASADVFEEGFLGHRRDPRQRAPDGQ